MESRAAISSQRSHAWMDAVKPRPAIVRPWRRKGCSGELFRAQSIWDDAGVVAAAGKGIREEF